MNPDARTIRRSAAAWLIAAALPLAAWGHEGHEHDAAVAASPVSAAPRLVAVSDAFELVGVLGGRRLELWLDGFADNAPIVGARLDLELDGRPLAVRADGDRYLAELPEPAAPGSLPVIVTVSAGQRSDLLAGELVVPAPGGISGVASAVGSGEGARPFGAAFASLPGDWRVAAALAALAAGTLGWLAGRWRR